jgi:hypothetical protein
MLPAIIPGDVCVYPEKRTFKPARGLEIPLMAHAIAVSVRRLT